MIAGIRNLRAFGVEQLPLVPAGDSVPRFLSEELGQGEGIEGETTETSRFFGLLGLFLRPVLLGLVVGGDDVVEFFGDRLPLLTLPLGAIRE